MSLTILLPEWLEAINQNKQVFSSMDEAMQFVIELSRRNISDGGGPFAAVVLNESMQLIAAGVNRVVSAKASILHAEMLALLLAQQRLGTHDLAISGSHILVTSCAPCAMCLGAIPWAGVARVVCGARGEDAEAIGFDEGDKPVNWQQALSARGIGVDNDVCREEAVLVMQEYRGMGGRIY